MRDFPARLQLLKASLLVAFFFLEIAYYSTYRVRFWLEGLLGRGAQAEATARRMVEAWAERLLARLGCRVEVEGRENVPPSGPLIVMTNHQSMYDILVFLCKIRGPMGFVAKRELFRIPFFSYWMRQIHCVALDRKDPRSALALYGELGREIQTRGTGLILFPEGTRTRDPGGAIGPFKEGSLRLATLGELPILPVSVDGTRFLTQGRALYETRRGGRLIRIKIGPVIPGRAATAPERKKLMAHIRHTITTNFETIKVNWPAPHPEAEPGQRPPESKGKAAP